MLALLSSAVHSLAISLPLCNCCPKGYRCLDCCCYNVTPHRHGHTTPSTCRRLILHDWNDADCQRILAHVRAAMTAASKGKGQPAATLALVENVIDGE